MDMRNEEEDEDGLFSSQSIAFGLIGIASLYLLIMICKASRNQEIMDREYNSEYYEYVTMSYDYKPYQSELEHAEE